MHRTATLLFAFALFTQSIAASAETTEFRRIISAYYYDVGENLIEAAMSLYHNDSPEAGEVRRELEDGQSAYLQRTSTLSLDLVQHDGERAVVRATHRHLRIIGIKFMEEFTETHYVFRRRGDVWKIWSSVNHPQQMDSPLVQATEMGASTKARVTKRHPKQTR